MNKSEIFDRGPAPEGSLQHLRSQTTCSPYDQSLPGEFARLLLLLVAIPLLVWFVRANFNLQSGIFATIATVVLLASLFYAHGAQVIRISLLALLSINIFSSLVSTEYLFGNEANRSLAFPTGLLFVCLTVALLFEAGGLYESISTGSKNKLAAWSVFAVPALVYILAIPVFDWIWVSIEGDERRLALRDPDWKFWNEAVFRAYEFSIFGIFTYIGACIGSFLNVVAYSVPRGKSFVFRGSKCQRCGSKISRIDNLPIFSYLNLGARCRNCSTFIPARYLIVELVVATVFGSLFLYELITGCQNIPSMRISHEGILWIILYPKWPAIAIYLYHALFMSSVLVLAIIECDRQPIKPVFAGMIAFTFTLAPVVYWPIQPVLLADHLPFSLKYSPIIEQLLKLAIGGMAGAMIAFSLSAVNATFRTASFRFALTLTGIVFGWQALTQIMVFYFVCWLAIRFLPKLRDTGASQFPTSVLLAAIMLHHPFWKTIADCWN